MPSFASSRLPNPVSHSPRVCFLVSACSIFKAWRVCEHGTEANARSSFAARWRNVFPRVFSPPGTAPSNPLPLRNACRCQANPRGHTGKSLLTNAHLPVGKCEWGAILYLTVIYLPKLAIPLTFEASVGMPPPWPVLFHQTRAPQLAAARVGLQQRLGVLYSEWTALWLSSRLLGLHRAPSYRFAHSRPGCTSRTSPSFRSSPIGRHMTTG